MQSHNAIHYPSANQIVWPNNNNRLDGYNFKNIHAYPLIFKYLTPTFVSSFSMHGTSIIMADFEKENSFAGKHACDAMHHKYGCPIRSLRKAKNKN